VKDVFSVDLVDERDGTTTRVVDFLHLQGDTQKTVSLPTPTPATRAILRLGEGGLARFKMFGTPLDPLPVPKDILRGANVFWASDSAYGSPNLVLREQRQGKVMAGWESRRHSARQAIAIALPNNTKYFASKIIIDTYMHCLNSFRFMCVFAGVFEETSDKLLSLLPKWRLFHADKETIEDSEINDYFDSHDSRKLQYALDTKSLEASPWKILLPMVPLKRDTLHEFSVKSDLAFTHLIFMGLPDGGVHRLVVIGDVCPN